jgi:hypothetical protein
VQALEHFLGAVGEVLEDERVGGVVAAETLELCDQ